MTEEFRANVKYDTISGDCTSRIQFGLREDGMWFTRQQSNGHWGYRWSAWRACGTPHPGYHLTENGMKCRLPAV